MQDLSAGGALLRSGRVPAVGENVLLHRGVYCCRATVRWVAGARYGLQFAQTLGAEQLALLMQPLPEDRERTSPLLRILESMRDDVFGIR